MEIIREEVEVREHSRVPRWRWLAPVAIVVVVGLGIAAWIGDRGGEDRHEPPPTVQAVAVSPNQAVFMVWTEYERWRTASQCAGEVDVRMDEAFDSTARYISMAADALGIAPLAPDVGSLVPLYTPPTDDLSLPNDPIDPACLPQEEPVDISDAGAVMNAVSDASKDEAFLAAIADLVWQSENPDAYAAMRLQAGADPSWPPISDPTAATALLAEVVKEVEQASTWRSVGTVTTVAFLIAFGHDADGSVLVIQVAQPASLASDDPAGDESLYGWPLIRACGEYKVTLMPGFGSPRKDGTAIKESTVAFCKDES